MNIGTFLKKERKKAKLQMSEVAEKLKTKKSFIEALEEDDFNNLPAKVYLRGLVKNYCDLLEVPSKKFLRQLDKEYKIPQSDTEKLLKVGKKTPLESFCLADAKKWLALVLFLIIFLYLALKAEDIFGRPQIEISYPADDLVVADSEVFVQGKIEGVFKNFSINGQRASVSEDGEFREKIFLKQGINEIVFSAVNLFGRQAEESIRIINQK